MSVSSVSKTIVADLVKYNEEQSSFSEIKKLFRHAVDQCSIEERNDFDFLFNLLNLPTEVTTERWKECIASTFAASWVRFVSIEENRADIKAITEEYKEPVQSLNVSDNCIDNIYAAFLTSNANRDITLPDGTIINIR
jgi:hypothetical protein